VNTCKAPRKTPEDALDLRIANPSGFGKYLRSHLIAAHAILRPPLRHLSLALIDDPQMSTLHEEYLGISGPTDVLTFELDHDATGRVLSGEVVLCVPEARRQARQNGSAIREELLLYALHGMLHLSGFDDRTAGQYRVMHRKEDQILTRLGVGPVFSGGGGRRGAKLKDH
jgi:probable rRNA maturation factor